MDPATLAAAAVSFVTPYCPGSSPGFAGVAVAV